MVLQHLRGFVQGVRGTFADLAGYVILDVSRRGSGKLAEQLSPGRDHRRREAGAYEGDAVAGFSATVTPPLGKAAQRARPIVDD